MWWRLLVLSALTLTACTISYDADRIEQGQAAIKQLAISRAEEIYRQKIAEGIDLSAGPCLTENLIDDWVADIAHNPRQTIDDLPENQCQNYRNGLTKHFVELDLNGKLIIAN